MNPDSDWSHYLSYLESAGQVIHPAEEVIVVPIKREVSEVQIVIVFLGQLLAGRIELF